MARPTAPEECANCGADIPRNVKACPECGADERTGWRETSIYDGLDLPNAYDGHDNDGPSYGESDPREKRVKPVSVFWIIVGFGLLALFVLGALGLR